MMNYGRGRSYGDRGFNSGEGRSEEMEVLEPSALLHVSDLPEHTLEIDLQRLFTKYGSIRGISMLPHKGQAFIEFDDIDVAKGLVDRAKSEFVQIANRRIKVNFSTSQHIVHKGEGLSTSGANKVILFTVYNAHYPITVDVLYQICSAFGRICRIVIFRKFHLQAMVEFAAVDDATKAKLNLNGADIYSGCCTLKAEFAAPTVLTVTKNDSETWDYENPQPVGNNDSLLGRPHERSSSLLKEPGAGDPYGNGAMQAPPTGPSLQGPGPYGPPMPGGRQPNDAFGGGGGAGGRFSNFPSGAYGMEGYNAGSVTPVVMLYGLNMEIFNCQRVFNLLCLYGNVLRVKFLRSMEGSVMVQMGDAQAVDRAVHNLSQSRMFGNKLQVRPSKQAVVVEVANPHTLPDGTQSFQDFTGSRNNRFLTPDLAMKNKMFPPFRTMYFWNCPPHFSDEQLREVFTKNGCQPPEKVMHFPNAKSAEKTTAGLVQWERDTDSAEALVLSNNSELTSPTHQYPFAMRLSFAAKPIGERDGFGTRDRSPFKDDSRGSDWRSGLSGNGNNNYGNMSGGGVRRGFSSRPDGGD